MSVCLVFGRVNVHTQRRTDLLLHFFLSFFAYFSRKDHDGCPPLLLLLFLPLVLSFSGVGWFGVRASGRFLCVESLFPFIWKKLFLTLFSAAADTAFNLLSSWPVTASLCPPRRWLLVFSRHPNRPGQLKVSCFEEEEKKKVCTWQQELHESASCVRKFQKKSWRIRES